MLIHTLSQGESMRIQTFLKTHKTLSYATLAAACVLAAMLAAGFPHARARSVQAQSLPLLGMEFAIDAGHGGFDAGAPGVHANVKEAPLNLAISRYLRQELALRGATVTMTRTNDLALGQTKKEDMRRRHDVLSNHPYTAVISIHLNTHPNSGGARVFCQEADTPSYGLARCVLAELNKLLSRTPLVPSIANHYVLRGIQSPGILVECGFISNPEEEALLQQKDFQRRVACAIADGLEAYFAPHAQFEEDWAEMPG